MRGFDRTITLRRFGFPTALFIVRSFSGRSASARTFAHLIRSIPQPRWVFPRLLHPPWGKDSASLTGFLPAFVVFSLEHNKFFRRADQKGEF